MWKHSIKWQGVYIGEGKDLINLFVFPKMSTDVPFFLFFLVFRARSRASRALPNCWKEKKKKNETKNVCEQAIQV